MYAFNDDLKKAWQALYDQFRVESDVTAGLTRDIRFDGSESTLLDPQLYFGHTCGYPLTMGLYPRLEPFCLPLFDVPGTHHKRYSSRFIVPANSSSTELSHCRDGIVAINAYDSNSGMNVLRHALATQGARGGFFSSVLVSGGHLASVEAVACGSADLAAIDCVSLQLIADSDPELISRIRGIGFSTATCGLPFVAPAQNSSPELKSIWLEALLEAFRNTPDWALKRLHLDGFAAVDIDEYRSIVELQNAAIEAGYGELN